MSVIMRWSIFTSNSRPRAKKAFLKIISVYIYVFCKLITSSECFTALWMLTLIIKAPRSTLTVMARQMLLEAQNSIIFWFQINKYYISVQFSDSHHYCNSYFWPKPPTTLIYTFNRFLHHSIIWTQLTFFIWKNRCYEILSFPCRQSHWKLRIYSNRRDRELCEIYVLLYNDQPGS